MFKKKKESQSYQQYQDTTGTLSNKNLDRGYWFVQHKEQLRVIGTGILLVVSVGLMGFGLYGWVKYLAFDYWDDEEMYAAQVDEFENYAALQPLYRAEALDINRAQVFESAPGQYDFVAPVQNINERFLAHVTYHYTYASGGTEPQTLTILPEKSHMLAQFGQDISSFPSQVELVIDDIRWERLNPHRILNVAEVIDERLTFSVENVTFQSPSASEGVTTPGVSFDIVNETLFGYWDPVFYTTLSQNGQMIGVVPVTFDTLAREETKEVTVRFVSRVSGVDEVAVYPVIDIFDPNVYIPIGQ